jgi:hypothetical protein
MIIEFADGDVSADFVIKEKPAPSTPEFTVLKTGY